MGSVAVTYHAPKGDEKVVETRGLTFFDGQTVEIDADEHEAFLAKAKNNPHFLVGDQTAEEPTGDGEKVRKKPGPKPKPKAEEGGSVPEEQN